MAKLDIKKVEKYVSANIGNFHQQQIDSLENLDLIKVLRKKNPYLFKAKYMHTSEMLIRSISDAFISSQEETNFGTWLEGLAIYVNHLVYGGTKSSAQGIDLEFNKKNTRYIVSIKSGPNWANASQKKKLLQDFESAKRTIKTSSSGINVIAIEGCCYGKDSRPDKNGVYLKYCGQMFWEFISNDSTLFLKIVEPLGYQAKQKNDDFIRAYSRKINTLTALFSKNFCKVDGAIDWEKLVKYNSGTGKVILEKFL